MEKTCPDCGHLKAHHTALVGCLHDGDDPCDCERAFPNANATPEKAQAQKVEAMARVERGTDPAWADKATQAVRDIARQRSTLTGQAARFCTDDVWELLEERQVPPPREPRALGPIMQKLANAGELAMVGYWQSRRRRSPVSHYIAGQNL